jgi:hypothetical protein
MEPFPITPRQFVWLWLAIMTVTFSAAAIHRRAQRLPFFRPTFPDVEVQQTWRSGASSVGLMGRLARARNCLWFAVTRDALHVGVHFPFNMFMPRFIAALDLTIPVATISSVSDETGPRGGGHVRVEYEVTDARGVVRTESVDLWPQRGDRFVEILSGKVRARRTAAPPGGRDD